MITEVKVYVNFFKLHKTKTNDVIEFAIASNRIYIEEGELVISNPAFLKKHIMDSIDLEDFVVLTIPDYNLYLEFKITKIWYEFIYLDIKHFYEW